MTAIPVLFRFDTGIKRRAFANVRLLGSWDANGRYSNVWAPTQMTELVGDDHAICYEAEVMLDDSQVGWTFRWHVIADTAGASNVIAVATEVDEMGSDKREITFQLRPRTMQPQVEQYRLCHCRRFGAHKITVPNSVNPGARFSVWAPYAKSVSVVFCNRRLQPDGDGRDEVITTGYIPDYDKSDKSTDNISQAIGPLQMNRDAHGVWTTPLDDPILLNFANVDHQPYMYRITDESGQVRYRTDLYSHCQIGAGSIDPKGVPYFGSYRELDGIKGCSVAIDPDTVAVPFEEADDLNPNLIDQNDFWRDEFVPGRSLPKKIEDLIIYELHIGSLGFNKGGMGTFDDAYNMLDYISELGINAIELLPMSEFGGAMSWGYGTSHYFAQEFKCGGRDKFKHFIKQCHRRGIAVIMDVVYNHYTPDAERAEWAYDSQLPEHNIYYWYEGASSQHELPDDGYVDNGSTGYAPRYWDHMVRKMFISSAVMLVEEFHIDGFRVDLTSGMHQGNVLHGGWRNPPPPSLGNVNAFGAKLLREFCRTLRFLNPSIFLIAEDHSGWDMVTADTERGGLGFGAQWYANFHHHLCGNRPQSSEFAKLILTSGAGGNEPLAMDYFANALLGSANASVVYHKSHDEAGNSDGSMRTIVAAVNGDANALSNQETRRYAEARCRFAFGMSVTSPGIPMFLFGEEIGAEKPNTYNRFAENKEDLLGASANGGGRMFEFYKSLIRFRLAHPALRHGDVQVIHTHNSNRVIAFGRFHHSEELMIIASLNNHAFENGYVIQHAAIGESAWKEVFNSDDTVYGGWGINNQNLNVRSASNEVTVVLPAAGFVVLQRSK